MKKILTKSLVLAVAVFLSVLFIAPAIVTAQTTTTAGTTTTTAGTTTTTAGTTTTTAPATTTTTTAPATTTTTKAPATTETTTVTGEQIPKTATPWYNVLLVGAALMLIGAVGWITIKKRAR
ncbi:MAG: LPXTG cell wall anchor domain-containing protein [Candidatus Humimicrobiaceae bacterium]